jgi:hypothetical protein
MGGGQALVEIRSFVFTKKRPLRLMSDCMPKVFLPLRRHCQELMKIDRFFKILAHFQNNLLS